MRHFTFRRLWPLLIVLVILVTVGALATMRPSNQRTWVPEQAVLPLAEWDGSHVTVRNVRNFRHGASGAVSTSYENRTYDLSRLETVWFVVSPFSTGFRGPAHVFLSFGFTDSQFVSVSVEARKEVGEEYSVWKGLLKQYEMMYVVGDERDLIALRTNVWNDDVYLYPIRAPREKVQQLFRAMLDSATVLQKRPQFYNTATNNCTTRIVDHVNAIAPGRIPYGWKVLLPGYADELASDLGLLDPGLTIEEARKKYHINERAQRYADDPLFSLRIREAGKLQ
jgi:hypothetical protein